MLKRAQSTLHTALTLGVVGVVCAWAAGCSSTLVLGTDCPEQAGKCTQESMTVQEPSSRDLPNEPEEAGVDARVPLASLDSGDKNKDAAVAPLPEDAGAVDAAHDAGVILDGGRALLTLANPDFERNGGIGGDLVLAEVLEMLRIPPINIIFAKLPDWYACFPLGVSSVSRVLPGEDGGTPQPRSDHLSFGGYGIPLLPISLPMDDPSGTPARQLLPQPMLPGTTYALEMEVWSRPDNGSHFYVEISGSQEKCDVGTLLGSSRLIPDDMGWGKVCVEFTPDRAFSHLLIGPAYMGSTPTSSARLWIDSLRSLQRCPQ